MDTRKQILDKLLSSYMDLRMVQKKTGVTREEIFSAEARFEVSVEFLLVNNNWLDIKDL